MTWKAIGTEPVDAVLSVRRKGAAAGIVRVGAKSRVEPKDVYVDRPRDVEQALDLRPAEAGANVALFTPFDDVVFEQTSVKKGITIASLSQVAADLMTSPGRGPNEAEALMQWRQENEDAWRAEPTSHACF